VNDTLISCTDEIGLRIIAVYGGCNSFDVQLESSTLGMGWSPWPQLNGDFTEIFGAEK
jgi:hypothetical protein